MSAMYRLRVTRTLVVPFFASQVQAIELPFKADDDGTATRVALRFCVRMPHVITTVGVDEIDESGGLVRVVEPDRLVP